MDPKMSQMTGAELLLRRVLGGPEALPLIEQELDQRALLGPPAERRRRSIADGQPVMAQASDRLVA